jgi:uncharacterized protein YjbJ (UPF0337 family)
MKVVKNLTLIAISMVFLAGLAACEKQGPAERAGEKIDESVEGARDKMSEAADDVSEKLKD